MAAIHFFTETSKLKVQSPANAYGPVSGNLHTQYRTTLKGFLNADAKAIAICQCKVYLQPGSSTNLINAVLVPVIPTDLENGFTPIKYFIYRGIKKADILDSSNEIIASAATNNGLVAKLWTNFNTLKADTSQGITATKPNSNAVGWQYASNPATDLMEEIIYMSDNNHEVISVPAGTEIGEFSNGNEGFEIVLAERMYLPDLVDIRSGETIITATAPGGGDIPGNEPIANMRKREEILNYIDPVAYYNLFYDVGVYESGNTTPIKGFDNLYSTFLQNFTTSNTLYIDIRNENGYSLNYYKDNEGQTGGTDYGMHVQLEVNGVNQNGIEYYTNYWPILTATIPANSTSNFNTLRLRFRKLYNPRPLIYADFAHEQSGVLLQQITEHNKFEEESDVASLTAAWSEDFVFEVPNINNIVAPAPTQAAWVMKLMNIRLEKPGVTLPNTVLEKNTFFDNLFGPVNSLPSFAGSSVTQWEGRGSKRFINTISDYSVAGVYELKVGVSSNDVIFMATVIDKYVPIPLAHEEVEEIYGENIDSGYSLKPITLDALRVGKSLSYQAEIRKKELKVGALTHNVLTNYMIKQDSPIKLGVFYLSFLKTEYNQLVTLFSNYDIDLHDLFISFVNMQELTDDDGVSYYEANIGLRGLDNTGVSYNTTSSIVVRGLKNDASFSTEGLVTTVGLQDIPGNVYTPAEYKFLIEEVEKVYQNNITISSNNYSNIFNDTPHQILTRIRAHHYGRPGENFPKDLAFNMGVPNSPYYETEPFSSNSCITNLIPPTANFNIAASCRLRKLYTEYQTRRGSTNEIEENIFENITRIGGRPTLIDANNNIIDVGHTLYGLDALVGGGLNGSPHPFYINSFGINHSIDFTSYIGDLASVVAKFFLGTDGNKSLNYYYNSNASESDLYGDVEMFGLKRAWDAIGNPQTLSEVFDHYYAGAAIDFAHYSNRWRIFCQDQGLIDESGGSVTWLPGNIRQQIYDRIEAFAFYGIYAFNLSPLSDYIFKREYKVESALLVSNMILGRSFDTSGWDNPFDIQYWVTQIDNVLDNSFLPFVRQNLNNEQQWTL